MTTSKIRIKLGAIEIDFEGSEAFLKDELPQLLTAVSDMYAKSHELIATQPPAAAAGAPQGGGANGGAKPKVEATTGSIAAKLASKSGPDLVMAAAARMTFVLETPTFSRQKIIDEMKTASAYFRATYVSNLTASLNGLVKDGKLNEPSQGNYALTAASLKDLEQRIV